MKKKTRITIDDRINLQAAIVKGLSLQSVCKLLKKNRTTIYRELTHYYYIKVSTQSCSHCVNNEKCRKDRYVLRKKHKNHNRYKVKFAGLLKKF